MAYTPKDAAATRGTTELTKRPKRKPMASTSTSATIPTPKSSDWLRLDKRCSTRSG